MRVRATAKGYDNVALRHPGEEFDLPEGMAFSASWMEKVGGVRAPDDTGLDKMSEEQLRAWIEARGGSIHPNAKLETVRQRAREIMEG